MNAIERAATTVEQVAGVILGAFLAIFTAIVLHVRAFLQHQGIAPSLQTIIMVSVLAIILIISVNALGGLLRFLIVLFLVLLAVQTLT